MRGGGHAREIYQAGAVGLGRVGGCAVDPLISCLQAMVMVQVDWLVLAVPNAYKNQSGGKQSISADALYGHSRVAMPYRFVIVGY